mmetsp:Transcript_54128/g.123341  ORF Transcript_54128/g.123341 Transcript_54128/m.123341 type:complete len:370 (+) Transcript_54128:78-1187(+)
MRSRLRVSVAAYSYLSAASVTALHLPSLVPSASLACEILSSEIRSRHAPARLGELLQAFEVVSSAEYEACVPRGAPDDFDYSCQQASRAQVLVRAGRPLLLEQAWGEGGQTSTGASIWPSAVALSRFMDDLGTSWWTDKSVVELGSGLGLNGLTAASLGTKSVVLTDGDAQVLELAAHNLARNFPAPVRGPVRGSSSQGPETAKQRPCTAPLLFGDGEGIFALAASACQATAPASAPPPSAPPSAPLSTGAPAGLGDGPCRGFDVIVGSDLTYKRSDWPDFISTVKGLSHEGTVVFYATVPRYRGEWEALGDGFKAEGFEVMDASLKPRSSQRSLGAGKGSKALEPMQETGGILTGDVKIMKVIVHKAI